MLGVCSFIAPVTSFVKIQEFRWLCVIGDNKMGILRLEFEGEEFIHVQFVEPGYVALPEDICCISGLSFCKIVEHHTGSYTIRCLLEESKEIKEVLVVHERTEIDQTKYQRLSKGFQEEKLKPTKSIQQFSTWIFFTDLTIAVLNSTKKDNQTEQYSIGKLFRLPGVHLCGAAFSPSLCALVTLTQPALFEDGSEFRIFGVDVQGDLEGPKDSMTVDNIGSRANSLSGVNFSHTDVVEMLGTIMKIFDHSPGNFSDIYACLLAANKVELLLNFLEKILIGNSSKFDLSSRQPRSNSVTAEQQLALLEQVTKTLNLESPIFTKHILSKILLNLLNFGQDLKRISPILRASIASRELKMAGASPDLLKVLSGNNTAQQQTTTGESGEQVSNHPQQQVIYECPKCQTKALSMTVGNFSSECSNCGEMLNLFLDYAGSNLRYLNEDAEVVCQFCGIVHPDPQQKDSSYSQSNWNPDPTNPARSVCLVCSQRLTTFRLLC